MKRYLKVLWQALKNMFFDLSFDIAGYIAYTSLLALFPFIMLLVSIAGYLGATEDVQLAIHQFYAVLPEQVEAVITPIVSEIMNEKPAPSALFLLLVAILWISSSSVEAIREGLNHAYGIHEKRSIFVRRSQAVLFVLLGSFAFLLASTILIFIPLGYEIWHLLGTYFKEIPILPDRLGFHVDFLTLLGAFLAIFLSIMIMYRWLPYHKIKLSHTIPGALISSVLWMIMAGLFSLYLRKFFGRYDILYGSLGGVIVTLIFFHMTAILILYGAQINRVLHKD